MVQRLARGPFKAEIRVRFPLALPRLKLRFAQQDRCSFTTAIRLNFRIARQNEAARAADAAREVSEAVYGERLK